MNKFAKVLIITILIILISLVGIAYSFKEMSVSVGETTIDSRIVKGGIILNPTFDGFVIIQSEIFINNPGVLDLENLKVTIKALFIADLNLNTILEIANGVNELGTVPSNSNNPYEISINATENIPILAVFDGVIYLEIDIEVSVQFIPYLIMFNKDINEIWNAPF